MYLLLAEGAYPSSKNTKGETPLHFASLPGPARLLLKHGADVSAKDSAGASPLQYAATSGRGAMVRLLLQYGASVSCQDTNGRTPLMFAAAQGHDAIVRLLLAARPLGPRCSAPILNPTPKPSALTPNPITPEP